jgi:hypothetical protein
LKHVTYALHSKEIIKIASIGRKKLTWADVGRWDSPGAEVLKKGFVRFSDSGFPSPLLFDSLFPCLFEFSSSSISLVFLSL